MDPFLPTGFADAASVEDLMRDLLAARFPPRWLNRLDFERMVRVPAAWVAPRWRCAEVVSSIPLDPDGPEPQPTHTVVAVKLAPRRRPELQELLRRHVALLEREFDRRRVFGAPTHPPLVTAAVVERRLAAKGPRVAGSTRRARRRRAGARFVP